MPRIYVACLAAYNNGRLHGAWIDADQGADAIHQEVQEMLKASPVPVAEEWAIHDFDEFGALRIDEYESIEYVSIVGQAIAEHGDAMAVWLENDRPRDADEAQERVDLFEDAFQGEWDSLEAYADDYLENIGAHAALDEFGASVRIDVAGFARDLEIGGDVWTESSGNGTVYIFDNNV